MIKKFIKREWIKDAIPIFILVLLLVVSFKDIFFGNKLFVYRDLLRSFYPLREFSYIQLSKGALPLWDPYIHCGIPHLAEMQHAVFYPLSIIFFLFPFPQAFNYFIILHVFMAGLFTYILMRYWRYSRYASFLSAAIYMFSGYIISLVNLLVTLTTVVYFPIAFLFYERSINKSSVKEAIFTGIVLTIMFFSGKPEIIFMTLLALFLRSFLFLEGEGFKALLKRLYLLGIALCVLVSVSAVQLIPFIEFFLQSSRLRLPYSEAGFWSLPPYALLDLIVPHLSNIDYLYKDFWTHQSLLIAYYMGIFTVLCAILALKFVVTKTRKILFYLLALGLVLSFGRYTPIYYFLYKFIPGFGSMRYPVKFFLLIAFPLALLAGIGFEFYMHNVEEHKELKKILKVLLRIAFIASLFYLISNIYYFEIADYLHKKILILNTPYMHNDEELLRLLYVCMNNINRTLCFFIALSLLMYLGQHKSLKLNILIPSLLFLSVLDSATGHGRLYTNIDIDEFLKPSATVEFLREDKSLFRIFQSPSNIAKNIFMEGKDFTDKIRSVKEGLIADLNVSFGIYDAYGYEIVSMDRNRNIIEAVIRSNKPNDTNMLGLLNVKYLISPKEFDLPPYKLIKKFEKVNIYENLNVLPRAFLVEKPVVIKSEKEIFKRLMDKNFDPKGEVILEEAPILIEYDRPDNGHEEVSIIKYAANEVIIDATLNSPKFLVLSDSFYPGWKAYIDDRFVKLYRADYILRAVYLKEGRHIVKFRYEPFSFKIGLLITALSILALCIIFDV